MDLRDNKLASVLATAKPTENRAGSITGVVLCTIAVILGVLRLIAGLGIL
ncbi:MAG TPA: hypothetical protein VI338_02005 [Nitrososphaera sp.]|nr:hypothetical protein [Nitrososphaera sp.]